MTTVADTADEMTVASGRSLSGRTLVTAVAALVAVVAAVAPAPSGAQTATDGTISDAKPSDAQTDTDVTISDANFAAVVASALGEPDGTTTFTTTDLAGIVNLDGAGNKSIASIAGISHMTGLKRVNLVGNDLTSADFSSNTALEKINVGDNDLTSLTVTGLKKLTSLQAHDNELTSLTLTDLTELAGLKAQNNELTSVALPSTDFMQIYLWGNDSLTTVSNQRYHQCEGSTAVPASDANPFHGCDRTTMPPAYYMYFYKWDTETESWTRQYRGENIGGTEAHDNGTPDDDSDDYSPALVTVGPLRTGGA